MTVLTVIQYGFLVYVAWVLSGPLRNGSWRRYWSVFARRTWHQWLKASIEVLVVLTLVIAIGYLLYLYGGPIARFSWIQFFATPEERAKPQSLLGGSASLPWLGIGFVLLLILNVPRLARMEEVMFRKGTRDMKHGALKSVVFGLAHAGLGVPVAFCLALWITGMWLTHAYLAHGIREASWKHALYNLTVCTALLGFLVL